MKYESDKIQEIEKNITSYHSLVITKNFEEDIFEISKELFGYGLCLKNIEKRKQQNSKSLHNNKKITPVVQKKPVVEEKQNNTLMNIKTNLNKLSPKNAEVIYENINTIIKEYIKEFQKIKNQDEEIGILIFDTCSSNKFYSGLFTEIYKKLHNEYDFIRSYYTKGFEKYIIMFDDIQYVDNATEDYEKFCKINVINEKRKSISQFLVNYGDKTYLKLVVDILLNKMRDWLNDKTKQNEIQEIIDNLIILLKNYQREEEFKNQVEEIKNIITIKHDGLNMKTKFKIMDFLGK